MWSCKIVRQTITSSLHNFYAFQTWHGGERQWQAPTHKITFDSLIRWLYEVTWQMNL